jgi:lysylphosphatidylglycerol synthase-like protein
LINRLLPVAQVGGDFVLARLLAESGTPGPTAGASVVVDATAGLLTQLAFALVGIGLLIRQLRQASQALPAISGLGLFGLLLAGLSPRSVAACSRCWFGRCTGLPRARPGGPDR